MQAYRVCGLTECEKGEEQKSQQHKAGHGAGGAKVGHTGNSRAQDRLSECRGLWRRAEV